MRSNAPMPAKFPPRLRFLTHLCRFVCAGLFAMATAATAETANPRSCPKAADLANGIVFAEPARDLKNRGAFLYFDKRYRHLGGPYYGTSFVDARLNTSTSVRYGGLFTYKAWREGELVQSEEPLIDFTALLAFEPGTSHAFETLRRSASQPGRTWHTKGTYHVEADGMFEVAGCRYRAVQLRFEGTVTQPDGREQPSRAAFRFIPDLKLRPGGQGFVTKATMARVRKRLPIVDAAIWPFTEDAAAVLER